MPGVADWTQSGRKVGNLQDAPSLALVMGVHWHDQNR